MGICILLRTRFVSVFLLNCCMPAALMVFFGVSVPIPNTTLSQREQF